MELDDLTNTPFDPSMSDGCTCALDFRFTDCCIEHDREYYEGYTKDHRKHADKRLRACIINKGKALGVPIRYTIIAWIYYIAVRVFGRFFFVPIPNTFRKSVHYNAAMKTYMRTASGSVKGTAGALDKIKGYNGTDH